MARVQVIVHQPLGTEVRVYLNGQETDVLEVPRHSVVHLELRQVRTVSEEQSKHLFRNYVMSLSTHGRIVYSNVLPAPFYAYYKADLQVEEDWNLTFTLQQCGVHFEFLCEEGLLFVKGSVRSGEGNLHRRIWLRVMLLLAVPIFAVIALALFSIWSGWAGGSGGMPLPAAVGFTVLFLAAGGYVLWQMVRRLR